MAQAEAQEQPNNFVSSSLLWTFQVCSGFAKSAAGFLPAPVANLTNQVVDKVESNLFNPLVSQVDGLYGKTLEMQNNLVTVRNSVGDAVSEAVQEKTIYENYETVGKATAEFTQKVTEQTQKIVSSKISAASNFLFFQPLNAVLEFTKTHTLQDLFGLLMIWNMVDLFIDRVRPGAKKQHVDPLDESSDSDPVEQPAEEEESDGIAGE